MIKHLLKASSLVAAFLVYMCVLAGCGAGETAPVVPEVMEEDCIVFAADGTVTSYLTGIFDQSYYELSGLKTLALSEVAAYNDTTGSGSDVQLLSASYATLEETKVILTYSYADADTYAAFNDAILFTGSIALGTANGYKVSAVSFTYYKDGTTVSGSELSEEDVTLLVTDQHCLLYPASLVLYVSDGCQILEDGGVDATAAEGLVYIIIK